MGVDHFLPADTISIHDNDVEKLQAWFEEELSGPRDVVSYHAPMINPRSQKRIFRQIYTLIYIFPLHLVLVQKKQQCDNRIYTHNYRPRWQIGPG